MKPLDPNDPRFTAKALGEEETQDIQPEANEEFASLQSFADTLKAELQSHEETEALTEEQRERVRSAVEKNQKKVLRFPVWINTVAACLTLGVLVLVTFNITNDSQRSGYLTSVDTPPTASPEMEISPSHPQQRIARPTPTLETFIRSDASEIGTEGIGEPPVLKDEIKELSPFIVEEDTNSTYQASIATTGPRVILNRELFETEESLNFPVDESLGTNNGAEAITFGLSTSANEDVSNLSSAPSAANDSFRRSAGETRHYFQTQAQPVSIAPKVEEKRRLAYTDAPLTLVSRRERTTSEPWNREAYDRIVENGFKNPTDHPLSTFSIDVDTASYTNVRRFLNSGQLPPIDAVRIEEMVNYFSYDYEGPKDETPFAVHVDSANAPWNEDHRLVRIALQGEKIDLSERPDANLVFLIDVSGSMSSQNKLPLVQRSLNLLVDQMEARDRIAVVVYAGASGLALPSTTANNKETIQHAISNLQSGGSTNGGAGIKLAYSVAQKHFIQDGINRIILCTDGDFNVGTTDRGSLTRLIEEKAKTGVFFSVLGFGMGNYQDAAMEELSNKGNGNYGYVDSFKEARKVFVDEMLGTLYTIAKDVKIQVEFNPQHVGSYRLIGYENRMLAKEDFNDDTKDAGEIGAGHRVTALYEIVPPALAEGKSPAVDPLKYQAATEPVAQTSEMLTVKLRYKQPDEDVSSLIEHPYVDDKISLEAADEDFRFATAVASFGMLLRRSELIAEMTFKDVLQLAEDAKGSDSGGLRSEFIELVETVISLQQKQIESEE